MRFQKEVTLIGSLASADDTTGKWLVTPEGVRYRMGRRDTLRGLADRYMGSPDYAPHLAALQGPQFVPRSGAVLTMPDVAVSVAQDLGFIVGGSMGIGALPGGMIFPSDVEALIQKVQSEIDALQAAVDQNHDNIPTATLTAWASFVARWGAYDKKVSIVPIVYLGQYHDVTDFNVQVAQWEGQLAKYGPLPAPSVQPHPTVPGSGGLTDTLDTITKDVKTIALIALGVVALVKAWPYLGAKKRK